MLMCSNPENTCDFIQGDGAAVVFHLVTVTSGGRSDDTSESEEGGTQPNVNTTLIFHLVHARFLPHVI